jgi:hypothetical protein
MASPVELDVSVQDGYGKGYSVDRLSGEPLPPISQFHYTELGAFEDSTVGFRRNIVLRTDQVQSWREKYNNTGIFRSVLLSNTDLMLADDEELLFYGDLCFDMDIPKEKTDTAAWTELVVEIESKLVPKLKEDFGIPDTAIRFWFSGGRGMHVEVPAEIMGVWPHHDLNRIYGFYAREIAKELELKYLDPSLYGTKHLYRLEGSRHQRTGLYKFPLKFVELAAVRDSFEWMALFARQPRPEAPSQLYSSPTDASKALNFYATLVKAALDFKRPQLTPTVARDRVHYDPSQFHCVETLFSDGYLLPSGSRNSMALYLARHLRDNGFSLDEAHGRMADWATNHCDPPMTNKAETAEWERILYREFENEKIAGCTFIQNNIPSLCQEHLCPIGKRRQQRSQQTSLR